MAYGRRGFRSRRRGYGRRFRTRFRAWRRRFSGGFRRGFQSFRGFFSRRPRRRRRSGSRKVLLQLGRWKLTAASLLSLAAVGGDRLLAVQQQKEDRQVALKMLLQEGYGILLWKSFWKSFWESFWESFCFVRRFMGGGKARRCRYFSYES